jgi:hypothetical protein
MHLAEFRFYGSACGGGGVFRRTLLIPFDPAPGFLIAFHADEESWEIRSATWVHSARKFICCLGDDIDPEEPWESMKARYLPQGWTLEKELHQPPKPVSGPTPLWLFECRGEG